VRGIRKDGKMSMCDCVLKNFFVEVRLSSKLHFKTVMHNLL